MQDKNGNIYETTLNIAKARDGRNILYAFSNTKKIDAGNVTSTQTESILKVHIIIDKREDLWYNSI